jgi:hypothetical protein
MPPRGLAHRLSYLLCAGRVPTRGEPDNSAAGIVRAHVVAQ